MKLYNNALAVLTACVTLATLPACSTKSNTNKKATTANSIVNDMQTDKYDTLTDTLIEEYNTSEYKTIEQIKNDILPISKSINQEYTIIEETYEYEYSYDKRIETLIQQAINKNGAKVTIETITETFFEADQEIFNEPDQQTFCRVYDNKTNELLRSEWILINIDENCTRTIIDVDISSSDRKKFKHYEIECRDYGDSIGALYSYDVNSLDKIVLHSYFTSNDDRKFYEIYKRIGDSEQNEDFIIQTKLYDIKKDKLLTNSVIFPINNEASFQIDVNGETITNDNYNATINYYLGQEIPSINTIYESDWTDAVNNILPNGINSINENNVQYKEHAYIPKPDTLPEMPNPPAVEIPKELLLK